MVGWIVPGYGLAVCLVLAVLLSGHSGAAHVSALAPFAVLLFAVAAAGRRPGRTLAIPGLIATAAVVVAFTSSAGDWYADGALALGVVLLVAALLRSGASRELRRRRPLGIALGSMAGLMLLLPAAALVATLPGALRRPPVGCVDTCWGSALGAFFAALILAEVILLILTFVALLASPMTGLGALVMAVGLNMCFFLAPPEATPAYAIAVATWYLGLFILVRPWTRALPATAPVPLAGC